MDNDAFRDTYRAVNTRACVFEKTILTNNGACSLAQKFCIAEREGVHCGADAALADCSELLTTLRRQARFTLKTIAADATPGADALPHAKAMRIQVGGLRGLQAALTPDQPVPVRIADIRDTVRTALARFGGLDALPFQDIIKQIAAYQGRRRGLKKRN
jgi:hypothetical protein